MEDQERGRKLGGGSGRRGSGGERGGWGVIVGMLGEVFDGKILPPQQEKVEEVRSIFVEPREPRQPSLARYI